MVLYKDADTVTGTYVAGSYTLSGGGALFPAYDPNRVQTYGVLTAPFRFMPGPLNIHTGTYSTAAPGPQDDGEVPFKIEQIKRPSDIILVMDASQIGNQGIGVYDSSTYLGTYCADADLNYIQAEGEQNQWTAQPNPLLYAETNYPGVDAGLNKDYPTYHAMYIDKGAYYAEGNDIRFRHMNNTQANALFADGHADSFHFIAPGLRRHRSTVQEFHPRRLPRGRCEARGWPNNSMMRSTHGMTARMIYWGKRRPIQIRRSVAAVLGPIRLINHL